MAFNPQATINQIPTTIGPVVITLTDSADGQFAKFAVDVLDQTGAKMGTAAGNLVPHLTAGLTNAFKGFVTAIRKQAENEILP